MRRIALLAVIGILIFLTYSPGESVSLCRLEPTFNQLGIVGINYRGYCFLNGEGPCPGDWERLLDQNRLRPGKARLQLVDLDGSGPEAGKGRVLQVSGRDYQICREVLQMGTGLWKPAGAPVAWMVEGYLSGPCSDLPRLAEEILTELEATTRSGYRDKMTVNLVAYIPGFEPELTIDGDPVNFNLELRYNQHLDQIRVRAGVPILISNLGA